GGSCCADPLAARQDAALAGAARVARRRGVAVGDHPRVERGDDPRTGPGAQKRKDRVHHAGKAAPEHAEAEPGSVAEVSEIVFADRGGVLGEGQSCHALLTPWKTVSPKTAPRWNNICRGF